MASSWGFHGNNLKKKRETVVWYLLRGRVPRPKPPRALLVHLQRRSRGDQTEDSPENVALEKPSEALRPLGVCCYEQKKYLLSHCSASITKMYSNFTREALYNLFLRYKKLHETLQ